MNVTNAVMFVDFMCLKNVSCLKSQKTSKFHFFSEKLTKFCKKNDNFFQLSKNNSISNC